ncbi:MAG: hypothetical protein GY719_28150 [bacterium]|nr:hypothetical protein [bacterium]
MKRDRGNERRVADESLGGLSIDELAVEEIAMTSVGGVARVRAGAGEFLVREGDRLANGEVEAIDFFTPAIAWARFRRRVSSPPGVPYRPIVWLLAGERKKSVRPSSGVEEPANLAIGESWVSRLEVHRLDEERFLWNGFPPWTWGLTVEAAPRLFIQLFQEPEPRAPSELLETVVDLVEGGGGETLIGTEPGFGDVYFRFTSRESIVRAVAGELGVAAPPLPPPVPPPVFGPVGVMTDVSLFESAEAGPAAARPEAANADIETIEALLAMDEANPEMYLSYDPARRRDPFRDLSARRWEETPDEGWRPRGVAGLLIDDLEVEGLFMTPGGPVAEVSAFGDRSSRDTFALREGRQLWDGDVVRIDFGQGGVVFKQAVMDPAALRPFREVVKTVDPQWIGSPEGCSPEEGFPAAGVPAAGAPGVPRLTMTPATASGARRKVIDPVELSTVNEILALEEVVLNQPAIYDYDPAGRRDPLRPPPNAVLPRAEEPTAETVPSALAELTCGRLTQGAADDLLQVLERASQRLERYLWDRRLAQGTSGHQGAWARRYLADVERAASQDLARLFGDELSHLESIRAALDPPPVEMFALLGDLNLIAGRLPAAAKSYGIAERISPAYEPLCGRLYDGKLYGAESFRAFEPGGGSGWHSLTGYLLAWDLDSQRVQERYLLPDLPEAFAAEGEALEISITGADSVRLVGGRLEPQARVLADLFTRPAAIWNSVIPAMNFVALGYRDLGSPFAVRQRIEDWLPVTLPELEKALRAAADRDPTQPWHAFWLGQTLWAQGRFEEAETLWQDVWGGAPKVTPYYELLWMAAFHETYGQPEWADRGFDHALEARRGLGAPIFSSRPVERGINAAASWLGAGLRGDSERRYLWWRRQRQISGQAAGDAFSAALWADFFERRGDRQGYRSAIVELERARAYPFDPKTASAWLDYSLYLTVAAAAMLFAQLAVLGGRLVCRLKLRRLKLRRLKLRRLKWRGRAVPVIALRSGRDLLIALLALYVALSLSVLAASHVVYLRTLPFEPGDVVSGEQGAAEKGQATYEERFCLTGTDLLRAWLTTGVVRPATAGHGPLIARVQELRSRSAMMKTLLVAAAIAAMFVVALPAGVLLAWRRARDLVTRWIPGASLVRAGARLRGYLAFGLFVFAMVPLTWLASARAWGAVPAPGLVSANFLLHPGLQEPLLPPSAPDKRPMGASGGVGGRSDFERLHTESFASLLWSYPASGLFWSLVACALATSLLAHGIRLRQLGSATRRHLPTA